MRFARDFIGIVVNHPLRDFHGPIRSQRDPSSKSPVGSPVQIRP